MTLPQSQIAPPQVDTFTCSSCRQQLELNDTTWTCTREGLQFHHTDGIPDFILPSRRRKVEEFLTLYQEIRSREHWGDDRIEYYQGLPYSDISGRHRRVWKLRSRTFDSFRQDLRAEFADRTLRVLDLGAGNCWLSLRLVQLGHAVTAVDTNLSEVDGLGVMTRIAKEMKMRVNVVRAEFDFLPFPDERFDVIVFGASLHYSPEPTRTLQETVRFLKSTGAIYLLDSPIYDDPPSGHLMIQERLTGWREKYGVEVPADYAGSFLTYTQLDTLRSNVEISFISPEFGLRWALRPVVASLFGKRPPARFDIVKLKHPVGKMNL
jgi:SAM-dependent methyltransferase